jgi:hypothetical protein
MKKVLIFMVLAMVIAGGVFAQSVNTVNNWISGEVSLLGGGVRYERMLMPNLSIGGYGYYNNTFILFTDMGVGAFARYYFWKGLHAELGLGFNYRTGAGDGEAKYEGVTYKYENEWVSTTGFGIIPAVGWKFDVGSPGGFFLYPGIKVPITIGEQQPVLSYGFIDEIDWGVGVGVGFIAYFGMGYAF